MSTTALWTQQANHRVMQLSSCVESLPKKIVKIVVDFSVKSCLFRNRLHGPPSSPLSASPPPPLHSNTNGCPYKSAPWSFLRMYKNQRSQSTPRTGCILNTTLSSCWSTSAATDHVRNQIAILYKVAKFRSYLQRATTWSRVGSWTNDDLPSEICKAILPGHYT